MNVNQTGAKCRWLPKLLFVKAATLLLSACVIDYEAPETTSALPSSAIIQAAPLEEARRFLPEQTQFDAFVSLHGETTVMRWGKADLPINTHSVRKSLLSASIGIAESKGLIRLDETLGALGFDEPETPLTDMERQATIEDLLMSRSGIYLEASGETQSMKDGRPQRGQHRPGEAFYYNNWNFNVLGVMFEQRTGMSIGEALDEWIARPVGMTSFKPEHVIYTNESGSRYRQFVIYMSASDLARFGTLFVQNGQWSGTQVIPADWITRSVTPHSKITEPKPFDGYGFMWWVDVDAQTVWADGWRGQYMIIDPARQLVVVSRSDTGRNILSITWARLFGKDGFRDHHQHLHKQMIAATGQQTGRE